MGTGMMTSWGVPELATKQERHGSRILVSSTKQVDTEEKQNEAHRLTTQ